MVHASRSGRPAWFRTVAVVTLVAFGTACHRWDVVPLQEVESGTAVEASTRIRVHPRDGGEPVVLDVKKVDGFTVTGIPVDRPEGEPQVVTVDLREVTQVEVRSIAGWRTAFLVGGIILGILVVVAVIVAITKTSCPFVYVDGGGGLRFVGEAYSGATSRATQRDDLLPLPALGTGPKVVLSNEARETQFTDLLELVVVDHPPGRRALATHDAAILVAGDGSPPIAAVDLDGRDTLAPLLELDGRTWQTDLGEVSRRSSPPVREGLVLTFATPAGGDPRALVLDAGNTPWLDVVFGRFFALLGERLESYQDQTDQPEAREPTLAWREREGVDLRVEMERGGRWERVAVVPTVGPASLRQFAVPLPGTDGPVTRVRLTGGVGFWMADRIVLAPVEASRPVARTFLPARAVQSDGTDVRRSLATTDGDYQVLATRGERVDLAFELPAPAPGLVRDAFLHTSGYYRVHTPPQADLSAGTLYRLRDEPGSLSRFSVDLFRGYLKAAGGPVAAAP